MKEIFKNNISAIERLIKNENNHLRQLKENGSNHKVISVSEGYLTYYKKKLVEYKDFTDLTTI